MDFVRGKDANKRPIELKSSTIKQTVPIVRMTLIADIVRLNGRSLLWAQRLWGSRPRSNRLLAQNILRPTYYVLADKACSLESSALVWVMRLLHQIGRFHVMHANLVVHHAWHGHDRSEAAVEASRWMQGAWKFLVRVGV
jgi:hypothetical protein